MTDELRVLDVEPDRFAFFAWKNLTIMVWLGQPDPASITRLVRTGERRIQEHAEGLSDIHVIHKRIGLPDAETRAALIEGSRIASPHLAAVAVVLGGDGFWASAMRGLITSVRVLMPGQFDLRLFVQADDVVEWLPGVHERRTGVTIPAAALRYALHSAQLQAAGGAREPRLSSISELRQ